MRSKLVGAALGRRVLSFALFPLLTSAMSLILLPVIARVASPADWVGIGVGSSVGAVAATIVTYGWAMTGPVLSPPQPMGNDKERTR